MKKLILFALLIAAVVMNVAAQNRSIDFEQTKEWKKIVKKAKKEKKLIFVDCYTSWCGPCKLLARDVFTNDEVANFFNANFVNAKFDMEKDADGKILRKQFDVKFFPTLVFVDPVSGEIVHRLVGAGRPDWLIAGGKLAMEPDNNLRSLTKRYAAGERDVELLRNYMSALYAAYARDEAARIACEYLDPMPLDSLLTPGNWYLIERYVSDPLCPLLKRVMAERKKFYAAIGQENVDKKIEKAINAAVKELTDWKPKKQKPFDESRNRELIDYLMSVDFATSPGGLAALYTAVYAREKDFRGMLDKMNEVLSYNLFRNGAELEYFQDNLRQLAGSKDTVLIEEGIRQIDHFFLRLTKNMDKCNVLRTKEILQERIGDTAGAEKSKQERERYVEERKKEKVS